MNHVARQTKLRTTMKSRVAFVHEVADEAIFLLVHPCGELLLCSNSDRSGRAARWDRACLLWVEEHQEYWMCKYGVYDKKFPIHGLNETELTTLAITFGIEFRPKGMRPIEAPMLLDSFAARSLLTWTKKHPKLAKEHSTVFSYLSIMSEVGVSPLSDDEYTGF